MAKILITGAHFTPAIAVIEELKKYPNTKIVYIGRKTTQEGDLTTSQEYQVLPKLGVKFISIITGRLQREFSIYTIPSLLKIPVGFLQAFYFILSEKPDVVLSFGGYVAVPLVLTAWLFSIPVIIHEQTLISGLANKVSTFFADKAALSFGQNTSLDDKSILVGNPLRKEILSPVRMKSSEYIKIFGYSKKNNLPVILIMGGNQGSHIINKTIEESSKKLLSMAAIIHITGDNKYEDFQRITKLQNERYLVKRWIGLEIGAILQRIDLCICRAGVNTLNELALFGKPALVIPFEPLYLDEQNKNARYFQKLGLVKILSQSRLDGKSLLLDLKFMLKNLVTLTKAAKEAKKIIIKDAASRLALETMLLVKE